MKTSKNILIGERLKDIREAHNLTQVELVERLNDMLGKSNDKDSKLYVRIDRYKLYEQGRSTPNTEVLIALSDYYDVSVDYLLARTEYTKVSNELVGKEYGLSDYALIGLKNLQFLEIEEAKRYTEANKEGKEITYTGTPLSLLDFMLSDYSFMALLIDLLNYTFPVFNVPVFHNDKTNTWKAPKDMFSHCGDNDDWNLYLARSTDNPSDNKLVVLNKKFLEGVAKYNLDRDLQAIRNGYIKSLLDGRKKPIQLKWVDED